MTKRVLVAGIFHETHTFLEGTTRLADFEIRRGDELLAVEGDGSPLSAALEVGRECGWEIVPSIDMRATPSATVEHAVLETFLQAFSETWQQELARGIDGVDLILHGAMVTDACLDVEGEIVRRIRQLPGADSVPICGVLDLHGNMSAETFELTQGLVVYRSNPHIDSHAASTDGARLLARILSSGQSPQCVFEQPPLMWPPTGTGTADDPMRTLEQLARQIEQDEPDIAHVNVFGGFAFADTPDTGVSFSAVTFGDPEIAREKIRELSRKAVAMREQGNVVDPPLPAVLPEILERASRGDGPVVIVEPADNIGGGAPGDGTAILRAFVEQSVERAAVVINDPAAVEQLNDLPAGSRATVSIGGRGSRLLAGPLELEVELLSRSDGEFDLEDRNSHLASMAGVHISMGPCATVRHQGIQILLTSRKTPPFDLGQLRSQGIEPESMSLIGVKAAVAHRRAYEPIQAASWTVSTSGPCSSDLTSFPFQHVRRPVFPLDTLPADAPEN